MKNVTPDGDPILDLADVCDLNEILIVRRINQERAHKAVMKQHKAARRKKR